MRARFLREGQLAAAVRHPNVVAVLGAEEVEGTPVIAMELLYDGTLKDRVKKRGPLPVAEAVDAALQIIDGLESAHGAGVLHRDVKPANCFGAADGTVKVGDFGLSISTLVKAEQSLTQSGAVLGTPAFAAPEQLRGAEIDARADIYAVGATLYFLLTGKPTHDAETLVALIAAVLERKPKDIRELRPDLPRPLGQAVMRCLEKDPARRFPSYPAMRAALMPYGTGATTPAKPGIRFVAGVIDGLFTVWLELIGLAVFGETSDARWISKRDLSTFAFWFGSLSWTVAWFAVSEAIFGTTLGKYLCGLRVAALNGQPPGWAAAVARSVIYNLGLFVMPLVAMSLYTAERYHAAVAAGEMLPTDLIMFVLWLALFVTMRRRNGWATIHDLITGTRVVAAPRAEVDNAARIEVPVQIGSPTGERIGAFAVTKRSGALIEAYDENLRRAVWIVSTESGAPELFQKRRDLARPTRLRWLQGMRFGDAVWNAFEAPVGVPLSALLDGAQPWARVRCWLGDLAEECNAGLRDGTLPPAVGLDRVWITADGRAVLLEFPAPAAPPMETQPIRDARDIQRFLTSVADAALSTVRPLHATELIEILRGSRLDEPAVVAGNLRAAIADAATVSPRRRAFSTVLGPVPALIVAFVLGAVIAHEYRWFDQVWNSRYPGVPTLRRANDVRIEAAFAAFGDPEPDVPYAAMNTHIAGYYGPVLEDDEFWTIPEVRAFFWPSGSSARESLREMVRQRGAVTREELREADKRLSKAFAKWEEDDDHAAQITAYLTFAGILGLGIVVSLLWTLCSGTPLGLRICGLTLVRWSDGRQAGRVRAAIRLLVSWLPAIAAILTIGVASSFGAGPWIMMVLLGATLAIFAAAIVNALQQPQRGFADYLCGTAIVPR
jgi:uncharacterized RDD family membrane protein YckC